jgi:hypothetical protein
MKINYKKSGIMLLKKKDQKHFPQMYSNYPMVKQYKFLGINIDYNLTLNEHIKDTKKKTQYIIRKINWIPNTTATVQDKVNLWKILVRSIFNYGILLQHIIKDTYRKRWIDAINTSFRKCIGAANVFNKEVYNNIYKKLNTEKRAEKTFQIAEHKWNNYRNSTNYKLDEDVYKIIIDETNK